MDQRDASGSQGMASAGGLPSRLKDAREYLGLGQEFVGRQLKIPRPSVSLIESGRRKVSAEELDGFARLYKVSVDYLLTGSSSTDVADLPSDRVRALFRASRGLTDTDLDQVIRFADFLRNAGPAPKAPEE